MGQLQILEFIKHIFFFNFFHVMYESFLLYVRLMMSYYGMGSVRPLFVSCPFVVRPSINLSLVNEINLN